MSEPSVATALAPDSYREDLRTVLPRALRCAFIYALLLLGAAAMLFPFLWMLSTSLKQDFALFVTPPKLIPSPIETKNYSRVGELIPIWRILFNSVFVAVVSTVLGQEEFVRPMHLGATILPFRPMTPWFGVVTWDGTRLLDGSDSRLDLYPGLADWWRRAEAIWDANNGGSSLTLLNRVDFRRGLTVQFPTSPHRVVYTKGGQYLAAARLSDPRVVIDHKLYWATVASVDEARYLTAILNSAELTPLLAPLQSRGEHNPRDFDKYVWRLPIPIYDGDSGEHRQLVGLAAQAEEIAAATDVSSPRTFQAQRRLIRQALDEAGVAAKTDKLVLAVLGPATAEIAVTATSDTP